ncbi:translocation/assembly module TamB domain-containing protein [Mesobacterium sp. TK19101]|uniref:Translocation/assembly module TamB domain-containing protein n=1 Tax=Mesobacterium hydrothermale TaxID=3111907 RepID=A0ABU6HF58_9RHOB|nr:translocation/assembly module TamB domain-containing protein [Mesobacterium sp. TK19101]MEC3860616.1 translocation/assembly module TamB domain-containing protein [Mesobacterium sp. TK19101]
MRWLVLVLLLWPFASVAQDREDRGYIAGLLEDALGGDGRTVRIEGFAGALSSTATIDKITIADPKGIWLTLQGIEMQWTRSALLRGEIEIDKLSAKSIDLSRLPESAPATGGLPAPEAQGFRLPDLPVSVHIGQLSATTITIGAPVTGQAARLSLTAKLALEAGKGTVKLSATRRDAPGDFSIAGAFDNATEALNFDIILTEGAGGLAVTLLQIPDAPDIELTVKGDGTLRDFDASLQLATEGTSRLTGTFTLQSAQNGDLNFATNLSGDVTALFALPFQPFFGKDIRLRATGTKPALGGLALEDFVLSSAALQARGGAVFDAAFWPERLDLTLRMADPAGGYVRLPVSGPATQVKSADMVLDYARAKGENWRAEIALSDVSRDGSGMDRLLMTGQGALQATLGALRSVSGSFLFSANGFRGNPDVMSALGRDISGHMDLAYTEAGPLRISQLRLNGDGLALDGNATFSGLTGTPQVDFDIGVQTTDIERFSGLVSRPVKGGATLRLAGMANLDGIADLQLSGQTTDLSINQAQADKILRGPGTLRADVRRDETGVLLRDLLVQTDQARVSAEGRLSSTQGAVVFGLSLSDVGLLVPGYRGAVTADGRATMDGGGWQVATDLTGPYGLTGRAEADLHGSLSASYRANVPDVASLGMPFSGPVSLQGTVQDTNGTLRTDTTLAGPAGLSARLQGAVAPDLSLSATGQAPLGLLNPSIAPRSAQGDADFELTLTDTTLRALRGQVTLRGGSLVSPGERIALRDVAGTIGLAEGTATVALRAAPQEGGSLSLSGTVSTSPGFPANLSLEFNSVGAVDPQLYRTTIDGAAAIRGALSGGARITGRLTLGETRITLPNTYLSALSPLPEVTHLNATRPVARTLDRAGVGRAATDDTRPMGPPYPMDIVINAPSRVFVRGRGLDAELGGRLVISGTSDALISTGGMELIRGRLDILGRRFVLDEGRVQLQGDFNPSIRFVASTATDAGNASVVVSGRASSPDVQFLSDPAAPQDEVLSQLLFGRSLSQITPFQALQLASAVATLAGRGGQGVIGRLREGFGLDDLDISTGTDGQTEVTAGKYISEKVYTGVTVRQEGRPDVTLNIDLSPNVTAKGTLGGDGETSLGIFFEKDY